MRYLGGTHHLWLWRWGGGLLGFFWLNNLLNNPRGLLTPKPYLNSFHESTRGSSKFSILLDALCPDLVSNSVLEQKNFGGGY